MADTIRQRIFTDASKACDFLESFDVIDASVVVDDGRWIITYDGERAKQIVT